MGMGGSSSQSLKGTVHVFLPGLQAGRPGHLCLAVDPRVLPAGVEARPAQTVAATRGPRPTCTPLWPWAPPPSLLRPLSKVRPRVQVQSHLSSSLRPELPRGSRGSCILFPSVAWWGCIGGIAAAL